MGIIHDRGFLNLKTDIQQENDVGDGEDTARQQQPHASPTIAPQKKRGKETNTHPSNFCEGGFKVPGVNLMTESRNVEIISRILITIAGATN